MPGVDGLEVCRELRAQGSRTPILMLTARDAVADRVEGLEAGADDYLVKPFALEELLARVRALLRRTSAPARESPLAFADLRLDPVTYSVSRGDRVLELTRTEHLLLEFLLENPRRVLSREVIFDRVWHYDFGPTSKALDVYIGYLRRKTEADGRAAPDPHRARGRLRAARAVNLRRRVIVLSGVAVAVAVAAVSIVTYVLVRDELRGRVDSELRRDVEHLLLGRRLQRSAAARDRQRQRSHPRRARPSCGRLGDTAAVPARGAVRGPQPLRPGGAERRER